MLEPSNKHPRSIDGFIPSGNTPRSVGFGVPRKSTEKPNEPAGPASAFPNVGQTLATYRPTGSPQTSRLRAQPSLTTSPFNLDYAEPLDGPAVKGKKSHRFSFSKKKILKRAAIALLIVILVIGGWLGFKFVYNLSKTFHGGVLGILSSTKLKGEDTGRVNILLAGNSSDDIGHNGANLTDSIMVVSIDTKNNTAFLISVPRDLWVDIPDYGHAKINEAYVDGEEGKFNESGYFGGGMGLLQKVVQDNLNINLNYYALVNYNALRDMVNAVGGIDFTVKSDNARGLYDPSIDYVTNGPLVKLSNGVHHLSGEQALDLARARGDAYGSYGFPAADFDRTNNQRQMLVALKSRLTTAGVITNPAKLSSILDAIGTNVKTNFSTSEVRRLFDIGKQTNSIQSIGLNNFNGKNLLTSYAAPTGQSALIPASGLDDFSAIQIALKQLTSSDPVVREGATIVILNATDTSGLAAKAAKSLTAKNITVAGTDDARQNQVTTTIIDTTNGAKPSTKQLLVSTYGKNVSATNPYAGVYDADFILILGQDQVPATTAATNSSTGQ